MSHIKLPNVFQSSCTILHYNQQQRGALVIPFPSQSGGVSISVFWCMVHHCSFNWYYLDNWWGCNFSSSDLAFIHLWRTIYSDFLLILKSGFIIISLFNLYVFCKQLLAIFFLRSDYEGEHVFNSVDLYLVFSFIDSLRNLCISLRWKDYPFHFPLGST